MSKSVRICLGPDLLDQMTSDDPRAIASRRDIKRINAVMFQDALMRSAIARGGFDAPRRILDLGGGDTTFTLKVARRMKPAWRDVELVVVDRMNVVEAQTMREFEQIGWKVKVVTTDVFAFLDQSVQAPFDLVLSNLFIHHFPAGELERLLAKIANLTTGFVACEPKRSSLTVAGSAMLWAIGCTPVSVRDSVTGARAGFRDREVAEAWPEQKSWELSEYDSGIFSHCFVAKRKPNTAAH